MNNRTGRRLSSRKLAAVVLMIIFFIAAILLLRRFDPAEYSFYPKCTLYQATGLHCPGCGATRAMGALAAGRLEDAIRYNPLLILGGPIIAVFINQTKTRRSRRGKLDSLLSLPSRCRDIICNRQKCAIANSQHPGSSQ